MSVNTISPQNAFTSLQGGAGVKLVDVRTPMEYRAIHAQGADLIPLDALNPADVLAVQNGGVDQLLYIVCKSGGRSAKACQKFQDAGFRNVFSIDGGIEAWQKAGLPVVRGAPTMSLERQVRIAAGSLVLIGVVLGWVVHPAFFGVSAFVGAGLVFAGITDWCGMGMLIARMPWNQTARPVCKKTELRAPMFFHQRFIPGNRIVHGRR